MERLMLAAKTSFEAKLCVLHQSDV